ncbi:hypothetical protein LXE92_34685 [Burkholderia contaminans]|nr:hypothetical protein [Burkholderia contaminans]WFN15337.1 hypothetical protein LXE92_34685 [Burkholderia contaminans]
MQRLDLAAELQPQPGRLRRGDAERVVGGRRIEPEQACRGGGRAQRAERRGVVETEFVVAAAERETDPRHRLDADDVCVEQFERAACAHLREREQRRQQHGAGMAAHAAVHVVVVERVACITVEQRRVLRRHRCRTADDRCCPGRIATAHRQQLAVTVVARAGERRGKKIEQAAPRGSDGGWITRGLGARNRGGQPARDAVGNRVGRHVGSWEVAKRRNGRRSRNLPVPAPMGASDTSEAFVRAQPSIRAFHIAYSALPDGSQATSLRA